MKIKSIRITGMHKVNDTIYFVGNMAYLYGPNGVGKSTVLEAIQLAVLGYIPGTDKNKTAIFKHCGNGRKMSVCVTFDNENYITREYCRTSKGITEDVKSYPSGLTSADILGSIELPVLDFNQFIGMTANKMKDWFVSFLPNQDTPIDWENILTDSAGKITKGYPMLDPDLIYNTVHNAIDFEGSALDRIRQMNAYLKDNLSAVKMDLSRVEHTVQTLIYYADCDMSESVDTIRLQIDGETTQMQNLTTQKAHAESNAKYATLIDSYRRTADTPDQREKLKSKISDIELEIEDIKVQCQNLNASLTETDTLIFDKSRIAQSDGMCPYTKSVCDSIKSLAEQYKTETKSLKETRSAIADDLESTKLKLSEKEDELRQMSTKLDQMYGAANQIDKLSAAIYQDALSADAGLYDSEIEKSKKHIEELRTKLSHIEANMRYEELTDKLTNDKYRLEQNIEILKAWIKLTDVNGMQSEIMKLPFTNLATDITNNLQALFATDTITAAFNIEEKANSFSFGVKRNGQYIEYDMLSSGEKCLYTLALTMSLVEMSNAKLKMLLVDDLLDHLDSLKIEQVFETLYNCTSIQIILAGVQKSTHLDSDSFVINI